MLDVYRKPSKYQIRTTRLSVFIVSAVQLRNSRHWKATIKQVHEDAPLSILHQMNEHINYVGCLTMRFAGGRGGEAPFSITLSGTIEPRQILDYKNSIQTVILTISQCSSGKIDAKYT